MATLTATLLTLAGFTWTGPSCCDADNFYFAACAPMAYVDDMHGCGDEIDSAMAWCDELLPLECLPLETAGPDWRCCKPGAVECVQPLGEARWLGDLWAVACEANREPVVCDGGWWWDGAGWSC